MGVVGARWARLGCSSARLGGRGGGGGAMHDVRSESSGLERLAIRSRLAMPTECNEIVGYLACNTFSQFFSLELLTSGVSLSDER